MLHGCLEVDNFQIKWINVDFLVYVELCTDMPQDQKKDLVHETQLYDIGSYFSVTE